MFKSLFKKDMTDVKDRLVAAVTEDDTKDIIFEVVSEAVIDEIEVDDEAAGVVTDLVKSGSLSDIDAAMKKPNILSGVMDFIGKAFESILGK